MNITRFEDNGRRLFVEFECRRCKVKAYRPLKQCLDEISYFNHLTDFRPPQGWDDGGCWYPLFCPECKEAYKQFMNNEKVGTAE